MVRSRKGVSNRTPAERRKHRAKLERERQARKTLGLTNPDAKVGITEYRPVGSVPIARLSEADRTRLAVRDVQRKLQKGRGAPITLITLPGVQGLSHATRFLDGGRDTFIEMVQLAVLNNEPTACKWWTVYAELPPYPRSIVSFDDVCAASGVKPFELVPVIVSTAMRLGMDVGNLVAAVMHPKVIQAHVESASTVNGENPEVHFKDRLAFLQARSMAPLPRNTTISVNANASANAKAAAASASEPSVPSFSGEMNTLTAPRQIVQGELVDETERAQDAQQTSATAPFAFLQKPGA